MNKYRQIDNEVELCISPELEAEMKLIFEEEMQSGSRKVLEDGKLHLVFRLSEEKAALLRHISRRLKFDDIRHVN